MKFIKDDGGRSASGFHGIAGDCVTRAVAIAAQLPYGEVYQAMADGNASSRKTRRTQASAVRRSARNGVLTRRKWFKDYMRKLGFTWVPTMFIGSGCKVHLTDGELPAGRLIVAVSGHYTAVIDGIVHDTYNPEREAHVTELDDGRELRPGETRNVNGISRIARRCVYGYWIKTSTNSQP